MKLCKGCGKEKPVGDFYRAETRDGLRSTCKACVKKAREERRPTHFRDVAWPQWLLPRVPYFRDRSIRAHVCRGDR